MRENILETQSLYRTNTTRGGRRRARHAKLAKCEDQSRPLELTTPPSARNARSGRFVGVTPTASARFFFRGLQLVAVWL